MINVHLYSLDFCAGLSRQQRGNSPFPRGVGLRFENVCGYLALSNGRHFFQTLSNASDMVCHTRTEHISNISIGPIIMWFV